MHVMHATQPDPIAIAALDAAPSLLSPTHARGEDAHWARAHRRERYFREGLEYEDYAPAYCVGYIGYAQYGGRFEDAQRCLHANWERIKGDSRLGPDDAWLAIRAAWDRMAALVHETASRSLGNNDACAEFILRRASSSVNHSTRSISG